MADDAVEPGLVPSFADIQDAANNVQGGTSVPSFDEIQAAARRPREEASGFGSQFLAGLNSIVNLRAFEQERKAAEQAGRAFTPEEARSRAGLPPGAPREDILPQLIATDEPTTLGGRAGRLSGLSVGLAPVIAGSGGVMSIKQFAGDPTKLGRVGRFLRNFIPESAATFRAAPKTGLAVEAIAGASAGAGGSLLLEIHPKSDAAQLVGELLGGAAPALAPLGLAVRAGLAVRNKLFSKFGPDRRLQERFQRAAPETERAVAAAKLRGPTILDPVTGQPLLTPAQRTGDPGLLALERAVMEASDASLREFDDRIFRARQVIEDGLRGGGSDTSIEAARVTLKEQQDYLYSLLETRLNIAAKNVEDRVTQIGPRVSQETASRIANEEIESALAAARAQERELYAAIPQDAITPTTNVTTEYQTIVDDLPRAQRGDVPSIAREFLDPEFGVFFKQVDETPQLILPSELQAELAKASNINIDSTIKELRGLQAKLREVARNARAGDSRNLNQARIADDLADAISDDIANTRVGAEAADIVKMAVAFSLGLNNRFSRGTVGKMLGRDVRGGRRVPEGLTLEQTLGVGGPKGREGFDDLKAAFDSPEAPRSQMLLGAATDYMRGRFFRQAVDRGTLNERVALRFLNENAELLNRMPALKAEIQDSIVAGNVLAMRREQVKRQTVFNRANTNKTVMFIESGPAETFKQLATFTPQRALKEMQKLVVKVSRDETGEALNGLKTSFRNFLLDSAKSSSRNRQGQRLISGFELGDLMENKSIAAMASRVLSVDERRRMNILVGDLKKIEASLNAPLPKEGIIGDQLSQIAETVLGVLGAASARHTTKQLGLAGTVQIPGIIANRFRQLGREGVNNPAQRLIVDAIADEGLFKSVLLSKISPTGELPVPAVRRLNAWAAAVLAEHGAPLIEDE